MIVQVSEDVNLCAMKESLDVDVFHQPTDLRRHADNTSTLFENMKYYINIFLKTL